MKHALSAIALAAALIAGPALAADDEAPAYDKGPVWDFGQIQTKDGHFDDYMKWVSTTWKSQQEALKKAGLIIDYKVYLVADPRHGEPDIILATEYKNMAVFDRSTGEEFTQAKQMFGSIAKSNQEQADRGSIRTVLSDILVREAILK